MANTSFRFDVLWHDAQEARRVLRSKRLEGITFTERLIWWCPVFREFTIAGPRAIVAELQAHVEAAEGKRFWSDAW